MIIDFNEQIYVMRFIEFSDDIQITYPFPIFENIESSHFSYSLTDVIVLYSYTCPSLHCYSPIRVHMSNERIDKQQ